MAERTIQLRVRWIGADPSMRPNSALRLADHGTPTGVATEFGMQRGRWELVPGRPEGDDLVFETGITPHYDKAGRWRFQGPDVQGTPYDPFLYLSWRVKEEQSWIMRAKVDLSPLTEDFLRNVSEHGTLETTVSRLGGRERGHVQEWWAV